MSLKTIIASIVFTSFSAGFVAYLLVKSVIAAMSGVSAK